ncbi:MAG: hypothetical protein GY835_04915 [bacterium]|nr:hypothetical protein [bacterium]
MSEQRKGGSGRVDEKSERLKRLHEIGHLMGLSDDGSWRYDLPEPGHSGHLISTAESYSSWKVDPREVEDVVARSIPEHNRSGRATHCLH